MTERAGWPAIAGATDVPPVHVNVAAADLLSVGFVVGVLDDLRDAGAEPAELVLEIQAADLRRPDVRGVAQELTGHGIPVMIDGLGGSGLPLTELVHLPLAGARLGPQITAHLATDPAVASVAEALITLCRGVGWQSHLVGVEDDDQHRRARDLGADAIQGWLVGPPQAAADFVTWLAARS